ncbi:MAG: hypothetical protein WCQ00_01585 [bacterium]
MKKITILEIGLAGGLYNVFALLFTNLIMQIHNPYLGRFVMTVMQRSSSFSYGLTTGSVLNGGLWVFLAGFIQFGGIAFIFYILSTRNVLTRTFSRWVKSSEK